MHFDCAQCDRAAGWMSDVSLSEAAAAAVEDSVHFDYAQCDRVEVGMTLIPCRPRLLLPLSPIHHLPLPSTITCTVWKMSITSVSMLYFRRYCRSYLRRCTFSARLEA